MNKKLFYSFNVLWPLILILSIALIYWRTDLVDYALLIVISLFICALVLSFFKLKNKYFACISVFLLMLAWYAIIIAVPDYKQIVEFEEKQKNIIESLMLTNVENKKKELRLKIDLARLYVSAPESYLKVNQNVRHDGIKYFNYILFKVVEDGKAAEYKETMFDFAELAHMNDYRALSRHWFKQSYDFGVSNSLERYNELTKTWYRRQPIPEGESLFDIK